MNVRSVYVRAVSCCLHGDMWTRNSKFEILQKEFQTSRVINTGLFAVVPCVDQRAMNKSWFVLLPFHPKMGLNMTARRLLVLVCLFLAAASLQLASGQETLQEGLQEGGVDVDEVADATGLSEVRV